MTDAVIKCDSVYKIFGPNAKKMLQEANGNVDAKTFQQMGCIVGVNNASFEVSKGEMLVVMGLSGSGKSTLFNLITNSNVYAKDQLFATLDPTMRLLELPSKSKVIISDTVGFISDLPTELIAAFRATLEEVLDADLVIHIQKYRFFQ